MVIDFLRKNGLIVIGLGIVVVAAFMTGLGHRGMTLWIILGGAVIALGAAQRQKARKDRDHAR